LENISYDPTSTFAEVDKKQIDWTIHNIQTRKSSNIPGKPRVPDHPQRTCFTSFIRTAQHNIFNPDRPKITGIYFIYFFLRFAIELLSGDYKERLTALATMMKRITFDALDLYEYVDPEPEQEYTPEQFCNLKKRHQVRIKKAEKKKGAKLDTLQCKVYICIRFCVSVCCRK
jgi:hypothetical protein